MEIHALELPKLPKEDDGTPLWEWMKFLNANSTEDLKMVAEKNETIKKAVSALAKISEDQKARWEYDNRQKWLWDQTAREREAMARESAALARESAALAREKDTLAREKELAQEKEALAREKEALMREREALAREREALLGKGN
jgi:hypothetical protein